VSNWTPCLISLHDVDHSHGQRLRPSVEEVGPSGRCPSVEALVALESLDDPTKRCKALSGPYAGLWRLRVGDYRVILDIRRGELVIIALDVGNRSGIYD